MTERILTLLSSGVGCYWLLKLDVKGQQWVLDGAEVATAMNAKVISGNLAHRSSGSLPHGEVD
jgi:hypothetical protein